MNFSASCYFSSVEEERREEQEKEKECGRMEGGGEDPLLCCFFAQFDNVAGPRLTVEVPSGVLAPEFEEVSMPRLCCSDEQFIANITRPFFFRCKHNISLFCFR